ncbi:hypothetical protein [Acidaminobacter sp.]|uniref:hypothetical protein n=1 Tax=Acidaminobacter sp. TaxID=1872102 RepID=UPI00137FFBA2|nr:hypothetical protein [Acidaminobacter sp.]MDK9709923.1 hypothetical protein [Acidaminobacter sp.]MZQ97438.1 hypothetical protein [Acidaminobacter sp.]
MKQHSYFQTDVGKQTISGILTIGSLPLLLFSREANSLEMGGLGLLLLFGGMLSVPIMSRSKRRQV